MSKIPKTIYEAIENFVDRDDKGRNKVEYCLGANMERLEEDIRRITNKRLKEIIDEKF